ncbi:hypothetical protein GCM10010425_76700 [Streptomyces spororaveus]|uniref:Uncharacterized protein n=1 Tax=Streptomyces spororaveus TaxID=284039 RepID=A0ABQ3T415_9ACTN|nr:hypothetical protein Sspor_04880 [Streptomyces spororaveus]
MLRTVEITDDERVAVCIPADGGAHVAARREGPGPHPPAQGPGDAVVDDPSNSGSFPGSPSSASSSNAFSGRSDRSRSASWRVKRPGSALGKGSPRSTPARRDRHADRTGPAFRVYP